MAGLVDELQELSVEVRNEDLANVATVSAGGNELVRGTFPAAKIGWIASLSLAHLQTACFQWAALPHAAAKAGALRRAACKQGACTDQAGQVLLRRQPG